MNYFGQYWFNSQYFDSNYWTGIAVVPVTPTVVSLKTTTGAGGGYFVPDEFLRDRDTRRQWDTDDEIFVIMGGPLL